MIKPVFRVVGLDEATCAGDYCGVETTTRTTLSVFTGESIQTVVSKQDPTSETVTVRLKDVLPALKEAIARKSTWIQDFEEDPIVISKDLHEVLITLDRLKRAA
jgi:hypothetical protein